MKKYIIALAIGSMALMSNAQSGQGGHKPDPKAQTDKMAQDLGLSDDQKAKVLTVNTDASQKMETLRANKGSDGGNYRDDRKKIEDDKDAQLKGILTADQYQKYQTAKQEMQQKRKEGHSQQ